MESLLGKNVKVYFKNNKTLYGLLSSFNNDYVYLEYDEIYVIPIRNVLYYSIDENKTNDSLDNDNISNIIDVSINGNLLTKIMAPPNLNISTASEEVMKLVYSNLEVQEALRNKIQKAFEYSIGNANIILSEDNQEKIENSKNNENSFSMGQSGSPVYDYLNPTEMAQRLSKISKKGENK